MRQELFSLYTEVASHVSKKNNRDIFINKKTGRMFPSKSTKLRDMEHYLTRQLINEKLRSSLKTIDHPIEIKFTFLFPNDHYFTKKGNINKKIPDLSNLYELPQDCLQKAGVIENDTLIHSHDGSRRLPNNKDYYELHIEIFKHDAPSINDQPN
ncbi:MAG: RusA family crossover junction endodeoxyribonuclease [Chitinophagaceae bacterium]|nr:RusA family crossover junction endodeoxyribonuclease [Chitinophagaceae bacterium]